MRLKSNRDRPVHLGSFKLEALPRQEIADLSKVGPCRPLAFDAEDPLSLVHAMSPFMGMFDTVRDGPVTHKLADMPGDPGERARHLKAAAYYFDASMVGIARLTSEHRLVQPFRNPAIDDLKQELEAGAPKSFAAGIDAIYADILDATRAGAKPIDDHTHALVIMVAHPRAPRKGEAGCDWIQGAEAQRSALLAANTAVVLANYLRMLGLPATSHSVTTSDVDLMRLGISSGLLRADGTSPFVHDRFSLAVVSTAMELEPDLPLADGISVKAPAPDFAKRDFKNGPYPFETIPRRDTPTTFIDEDRVPRFPKRADFFARALFGDMGKGVQEVAKGGQYVMKSPIGACARRALGALLLLQFGEARGPVLAEAADPKRNAENLKAASYFLSADAVGLSRVPDWAFYSHDAGGNPMEAYHKNGISLLLDQGFDTMEGASGDDWISVAQSMRAYLRFSLLGGVIAEQVRRLGYSARVHSVIDGDVLQPPLLLLSGLGEVSRIGEVILNPFLGPRLKSGVVTTDLPMAHDKPIDFGLQRFCEACNKCARECPSGAITAGPKLMYNGYEIWKSDAEKCARYRLTNAAGGMCGRCMKTCPWNLEGLVTDDWFRWVAMNVPGSAGALAKLDDKLGRGRINPVKTWWWDIELDTAQGRYVAAKATNRRELSPEIDLKYEDQTLAVYPADVMPRPYPVVQPLDRDAGIERYRDMLTPAAYKARLSKGDTDGLVPAKPDEDAPPPVFPVIVTKRNDVADDVVLFELSAEDGGDLPPWEAGAHIDVVIAPEYQRQYSLAGDPADRSKYVLGILCEHEGRGGSLLMTRIFKEGRRVFISEPRNHFPLDETADKTFLMGGGIGVTPMITMAHRLHRLGGAFELHHSAATRASSGFGEVLDAAPWADRVTHHFSKEGGRIDFASALPEWQAGHKLYTCGSDRYMDAVFAAAREKGWPEEALSKEYFSVPEPPDWVNSAFKLKLKSGQEIEVAEDEAATDALARAGIHVDTKCSDGICGVCAAGLISGDVEHRDYVLSGKERESRVILCCSRARTEGGVVEVDL